MSSFWCVHPNFAIPPKLFEIRLKSAGSNKSLLLHVAYIAKSLIFIQRPSYKTVRGDIFALPLLITANVDLTIFRPSYSVLAKFREKGLQNLICRPFMYEVAPTQKRECALTQWVCLGFVENLYPSGSCGSS